MSSATKKIGLTGLTMILLLSSVSALARTVAVQMGFVKARSAFSGVNTAGINPIRIKAIEETATTLGAQGALAWRSIHINENLEKENTYLNKVFNFNQLLMKHNVLPPVITEASDTVHLDKNDAIRLSNKVYRIVQPARFVTTTPTWRDYLYLGYSKPSMPDRTLLPKNQAEVAIWNQAMKKGWHDGLEQANQIFNANLNRLKRDYMGIVLYRKLVDQKMVSAPQVAKANLGVTGDAHEMRVNDQVIRITAHSELQTNSQQWQPVLTQQ